MKLKFATVWVTRDGIYYAKLSSQISFILTSFKLSIMLKETKNYGGVHVTCDTCNSRSVKSEGTTKKTWSKFLILNFGHFFSLVQSSSIARELFFLILHIKNSPQNHSIVSYRVPFVGVQITCRTLSSRFGHIREIWKDFSHSRFHLSCLRL